MSLYDRVTYPSRSYEQTHPDRFRVMALLHGLEAPGPEGSHYLEVGCGDGTNLLALACALPEARFLGVDLAPSAIDSAVRSAGELGLANISFLCGDIADLELEGPFDYIAAHGLFSWVPEKAREALLELCSRHLAAHGVAYISYNAYPGCHLREAAWHMARYHTRDLEDPREKIAQARSLLNLLVTSRTENKESYHAVLEEAREHSVQYNEAAFFHDDLSRQNRPFYFHEFVEMAESRGLQFLSESDLRASEPGDTFLPRAKALLEEMGAVDVRVKEQYLDFFTGRRFRQTLLCRAEVRLERPVPARRLEGLRIAAPIREAEPPADSPPGSRFFVGPKGSNLLLTETGLASAAEALGSSWPEALPFEALWEKAGPDQDRGRLAEFLLRATRGGAISLRAMDLPAVRQTGPKPRAGRFARWQAPRCKTLTTQLHTRVRVPETPARKVLALADGSRDQRAMARLLAENLATEELEAFLGSEHGSLPPSPEILIQERLPGVIAGLARLGLFEG